MGFWKKVFFHSPVSYGIAFGIACLLSVIYSYLNDFAIGKIVEAILTSGIIVFLLGMIILCAHYGAFDTFAYGFQSLRNRKKRKYEDLVQYTQLKQEERGKRSLPYVPFMVVGLIFAFIGIILSLIIK